jgi:hypothetical protein
MDNSDLEARKAALHSVLLAEEAERQARVVEAKSIPHQQELEDNLQRTEKLETLPLREEPQRVKDTEERLRRLQEFGFAAETTDIEEETPEESILPNVLAQSVPPEVTHSPTELQRAAQGTG